MDDPNKSNHQPRYDWAMVHVWSYFKPARDHDEQGEEMPQENAASIGGERGYGPFLLCAERLAGGVRVVSPEELIWRIRMQHNPAQTRKILQQSKPN